MSDIKRQYTTDGVEIRTFTPKLPPGSAPPDPMKPPPFAGTRPKPAGQFPDAPRPSPTPAKHK